MTGIELSTMFGTHAELGLPRFEREHGIQVRHRLINWTTAWSELLGMGLRNAGSDLSQVGSTWLGGLAAIQALRPFDHQELQVIGGQAAFLPEAWKACQLVGNSLLFGIPWIVDTRLLVYRRDWLEKAGIQEENAFATFDTFENTLEKLQASGVDIPFAMPTSEEVLHSMAPWVWGLGGDYRTADLRDLRLTDPVTLSAINRFYSLKRFLKPEVQHKSTNEISNLFLQGRVGVAYVTPTLLSQIVFPEERTYSQKLLIDKSVVGAGPTPGIPFIGGSVLAIWHYSKFETQAIKLINYLSEPQIQKARFLSTGDLPSRIEVLDSELFTDEPLFKSVVTTLKAGRVFQTAPLWAALAVRLFPVFDQLWMDVFANPGLDLPSEIEKRMNEITSRLQNTLLLE